MNLEQLRNFIIKAKKEGYASGKGEIPQGQSQRPGFKELSFKEAKLEYRDSYAGYFKAPGQEFISIEGKPVWHMCYGGKGQEKEYYDIAKETFEFLKECLMNLPDDKPFRGPNTFKKGDWEYSNRIEGDIEDFQGYEEIKFKGKRVFSQVYFGGTIIHKE